MGHACTCRQGSPGGDGGRRHIMAHRGNVMFREPLLLPFAPPMWVTVPNGHAIPIGLLNTIVLLVRVYCPIYSFCSGWCMVIGGGGAVVWGGI